MAPDFHNGLLLLPDAHELMEVVRHLDPIIHIGSSTGKWAEPQKRAWVERHSPGLQVITTLARNKPDYCEAGDVLVNDRLRYADAWEASWGIFAHHTIATESLTTLRKMGPM